MAANITSKQHTLYGSLGPVAWATESHRLAVGNAYAIPKNGRLGQDYLDKNIPVIEQRPASSYGVIVQIV